jgi:hypothetical protein
LQEIYLSAKELGRAIDKPVRTIENWAANNYIRQNSEGKYGLISAFKYQLASLTDKLERNRLRLEEFEASIDDVKLPAVQRKLIAEADKEEAIAAIKLLELKKLQGELVNAEEFAAVLSDSVTKVKAKFINMPAKLALELSGLKPEAIQERLTLAIDEALLELGNGD